MLKVWFTVCVLLPVDLKLNGFIINIPNIYLFDERI